MPDVARRTLTVVALVGALLMFLAPVGSTSPAPQPPRTVTYPGFGLQIHLGEEDKLGQTSPGFRRFVHVRLLRLWKLAGGSEKCRPAPTVIVKTWMSDGFARVGEGIYAPCPGGGYSQLYLVRDGEWRAPQVLGSQEARSCSLMTWFDLPRPVADRECYTDLGTLVKYRTYELPSDYSTGAYAARVLARIVESGSGAAPDWARPAVVDELYRMRDDGADTFTVQRCFGPDDAEYGAVLGKAPRGCLLDVFYGDYRVLAVLRLHPARFGRWSTHSMKPVASS
jgi:hypothetical protein